MLNKPTQFSEFKTKPMPEEKEHLPLALAFGQQELDAMRKGFVPEEHDKWLIYMVEDALYIHRKSSGAMIFKMPIEAIDEDAYEVREAWVNRLPSEYRSQSDAYDAIFLVYLLNKLLLENDVPFPFPDGLPHQHKAMHEKYVMGEKPTESGSSYIDLGMIS